MALAKIYGDTLIENKVLSLVSKSNKVDENNSIFASYPMKPNSVSASVSSQTDKEFEVICKNVSKKLDNIPIPFSFLGSKKIKNETMQVLNDPTFKSGVTDILETARNSKPENMNKNIIELCRDKDTYNKVLIFVRNSAKNHSTINSILNNKSLDSKLYEYLKSDKALEMLKSA